MREEGREQPQPEGSQGVRAVIHKRTRGGLSPDECGHFVLQKRSEVKAALPAAVGQFGPRKTRTTQKSFSLSRGSRLSRSKKFKIYHGPPGRLNQHHDTAAKQPGTSTELGLQTARNSNFSVVFDLSMTILTPMNRHKIAAWLGAALALGWSFQAHAEVKENPYQIIIDRNPFGLRPIPPPPVPPNNEPPPPPPLGVAMTGITTLLGPPKVFLEFTDPQTKKVERPSALLEGDSFKGITVVSIDSENNRVRIKNGDAESWLDFEKNGVKAAGGGAPAPVPHPGFPGANPAAAAVPVPAGGSAVGASIRGGLVGGGNSPAVPAPYNPGQVSSAGGIPPRAVRTDGRGLVNDGGSAVPAAAPTAPSMTPAQATAIIEARRLQLQQQGNPMSRILPTTPLTRELQDK